jgi:hypothetical protein
MSLNQVKEYNREIRAWLPLRPPFQKTSWPTAPARFVTQPEVHFSPTMTTSTTYNAIDAPWSI